MQREGWGLGLRDREREGQGAVCRNIKKNRGTGKQKKYQRGKEMVGESDRGPGSQAEGRKGKERGVGMKSNATERWKQGEAERQAGKCRGRG